MAPVQSVKCHHSATARLVEELLVHAAYLPVIPVALTFVAIVLWARQPIFIIDDVLIADHKQTHLFY